MTLRNYAGTRWLGWTSLMAAGAFMSTARSRHQRYPAYVSPTRRQALSQELVALSMSSTTLTDVSTRRDPHRLWWGSAPSAKFSVSRDGDWQIHGYGALLLFAAAAAYRFFCIPSSVAAEAFCELFQ